VLAYGEMLDRMWSVTVLSVESPSISGRATPTSTGVTRPIQSEDSLGSGTAREAFGRGRRPSA